MDNNERTERPESYPIYYITLDVHGAPTPLMIAEALSRYFKDANKFEKDPDRETIANMKYLCRVLELEYEDLSKKYELGYTPRCIY